MTVLQMQLDAFDRYYNTEREHQGLAPGTTPGEAWNATPKTPTPAPPEPDAADGAGRRSTQRRVNRQGCATVMGTHFRMGKEHW
jgi:putative transposase